MKRLTLIALTSDEEKIVKALQRMGAVALTAAPTPEDADCANPYCDELESKIRLINSVSNTLGTFIEKPSFFAPLPTSAHTDKEPDMMTVELAFDICAQVEQINSDLTSTRNEAIKIKSEMDALAPWLPLEQNEASRLHSMRYAFIVYGILPVRSVPALNSSKYAFTVVNKNNKEAAVVAACHHSERDEMMEYLRGICFSEYVFPSEKGTPRQVLKRHTDTMSRLKNTEQNLLRRLSELSGKQKLLLEVGDALCAELERERAREKLLHSQSAFLLEGWVRSDDESIIEPAINAVTDAYFLEIRNPSDEEIPPSAIKNNKFTAQFEPLSNIYSRPFPYGIDATPFTMPFFLLFFGMMLSDAGFGLLLFACGFLFLKVKRPQGITASVAALITWGGLVSIVFGLLIGTFFGLSWNRMFFGVYEGPFPLLFSPLNAPATMLLLCCGLGVVHMLLGLGIKAYTFAKRGDTSTAMFDCVAWIFIVLGLIGLFALPNNFAIPFVIIALVGAVMVLLFAGRDETNILKRAGKGLFSLCGITRYLGDIASYSRVLAMSLIAGCMGEAFSVLSVTISNMLGNGILKILALLLTAVALAALYAFSLFISTVIAFVHTSRLQHVEFYGKFYEKGGSEFKPLGNRSCGNNAGRR